MDIMKKANKRVRCKPEIQCWESGHVFMATDCHQEDEGHILCIVSEGVTALMAEALIDIYIIITGHSNTSHGWFSKTKYPFHRMALSQYDRNEWFIKTTKLIRKSMACWYSLILKNSGKRGENGINLCNKSDLPLTLLSRWMSVCLCAGQSRRSHVVRYYSKAILTSWS